MRLLSAPELRAASLAALLIPASLAAPGAGRVFLSPAAPVSSISTAAQGAIARLDGRVTDTEGAPIEGATVTVIRLDRRAQRVLADVPISTLGARIASEEPGDERLIAELKRERLYSEWQTDGEGHYSVTGMFAGVQHYVRVHKAGFVAHEAGVEPRPAANTLDVTLGRAGAVVVAGGPGPEAIDGYRRGRDAYDSGDYAGAVQEMEAAAELLASVPEARDVYVNALTVLGESRLRLGDAAGAETMMRRVLEEDPENAYAHQFFGQRAAREGRLEEAERHFRAFVAAVPDSANGRLNLGAVMLNRGDAAGAAVELQRAVELAPTFAPAHLNLAIAHEGAGDVARALSSYRKVLELSPDSGEAATARRAIARIEG